MSLRVALRALRRRSGLTQHGLARKAGVSRHTIALVEEGKRLVVGSDTLRALARALGVTTDEILGSRRKKNEPKLSKTETRV